MRDIPLKVLIIDPNQSDADALRHALEGIEIILSVEYLSLLGDTSKVFKIIDKKDINAIYIDPILLGLDPASNFIFQVRRKKPGIVFVLFYDSEKQESIEDQFYSGERRRFHHYFKLDKRAPGPDFLPEVLATVRACQSDLSLSLTHEQIASLKKELSSIQENASDESAVVPLRILKEIQEQLTARQQEKEAASMFNKPAEFLGPLASSVKHDRCFIIMPYSETWSKGVEIVLKESCDDTEFEFTIAKTMEGRYVPRDIWQGISGSSVIIADLTGENANVAYEVGLADAIGREVVLICQDSKVPFDFLGQRLIIYENSIAGAIALKKELTERLKKIKEKIK
jgi:hypothetical protein